MVLTYAEVDSHTTTSTPLRGKCCRSFFVKAKSSFSLDNENANVSLIYLTRDNNSVLPVRWGWTTHILTLNTLDFDSELISKLMFAEIKSEIFERKQIIPNELNDNANGNSPNDNADSYNKELGNDKRFYFEHDSKP